MLGVGSRTLLQRCGMVSRLEERAVVLHSGGLDSTVCVALAKGYFKEVISLSIIYGSKHNAREEEAAQNIANHYQIPHVVSVLPEGIFGVSSTLMKGSLTPNPRLSYEELRNLVGPSLTYVPFRNGVLLSLATVYAMNVDAQAVFFGAHADDAHNYAYPDCTPDFISHMALAIRAGSYNRIRLTAPFYTNTKSEIVRIGEVLEVPFSLTYSCYEGRPLHCGLCPTCISRKKAFEIAGIKDPTEYESNPN